jgi:hypothetical protein
MMTSKHMGQNTINSIEKLFETWKPKRRFKLFKTNQPAIEYPAGTILSSEVIL